MTRWLCVVVFVSLVACGKSSVVEDGAVGGDASMEDASLDGGVDAAPVEPDGGPPVDEPCDEPGAVESVACGRCGSRTRFCTVDLVWAYGLCEGELDGACVPGAVETRACGRCGVGRAVCTDACEWEPLGECADEGTCTPGDRQRTSSGCPAGETREVLCTDTCTFDVVEACRPDGCTTPGAIETVGCGMCGTRERFCSAGGTWSYGACTGEGVCAPGTSGEEACGMCGTRALRCTVACRWEAFGACGGEGACAPGETRRTSAGCPAGETRLMRCSDTCGFVEAEACTRRVPIDVILLFDMTGSHAHEITSARTTILSDLVGPLLALEDVAVGVAEYADFDHSTFGSPGDVPFRGVTPPTTTRATAEAGVNALSTMFGGDGPESGVEALAVLAGIEPHPQSVGFSCPAGRATGGCWRSGAERVVIVFTDAANHNGPLAGGGAGLFSPYSGISPAPQTWGPVRDASRAAGLSYFAVVRQTGDAMEQHRRMITELELDPADHLVSRVSASWSAVSAALVERVAALR